MKINCPQCDQSYGEFDDQLIPVAGIWRTVVDVRMCFFSPAVGFQELHEIEAAGELAVKRTRDSAAHR